MSFPQTFIAQAETVDFGSWQGYRVFETAGIVRYFEDFKKAKNAARGQKMRFVRGQRSVSDKYRHYLSIPSYAKIRRHPISQTTGRSYYENKDKGAGR